MNPARTSSRSMPAASVVLAAWGPCGDCPEDVDSNGDVGFADPLIVLASWI